LQREQPEKDKQNVDVSPPGKFSADTHGYFHPGPALAEAGPNARPKRGASLSSDFVTPSCSVNRVTIVVKRKYSIQH